MSEPLAADWITDRSPTIDDTSARFYWCVDVCELDGKIVVMGWDDEDLQHWPDERPKELQAWRPMQ